MFTGLVEEIGTIRSVRRSGAYQLLEVAASTVLEGTRVGDSISVDGACQTVTELKAHAFLVETLSASLDKTTLGEYRAGRRVNLERALTLAGRLGGHFVQGHVDGTGTVTEVTEEGRNVFFSVELGVELAAYCVSEGSIAFDGVSLTIAELKNGVATVNVIPATWRETALRERRKGDRVNVEVDILGRYVAKMLGIERNGAAAGRSGLTAERLQAMGY
ncbi:MAG: riboflavin synthase [Alkalispirochaetaceae bacterium]